MESENTYIVDPESRSEKARLMRQGQLLTKALGLWPAHLDINALIATVGGKRRLQVLDVGCATGEWPLTVATKHLHDPIDILGIDISELMVEYAIAEANNRSLPNVSFQIMNALSMSFPGESFDIINIRTALAFVPRQKWPALIAECHRLLRSGGTLISIEGESGITDCYNPASAKMHHWLAPALDARGLAFWDGVGSALGIHHRQLVFLKEAGFRNIQEQVTAIDSSFGTPDYLSWLEQQKVVVQAIEPLVLGKLHVSKEEFDATLQENLRESKLDSYASRTLFLTATGQK